MKTTWMLRLRACWAVLRGERFIVYVGEKAPEPLLTYNVVWAGVAVSDAVCLRDWCADRIAQTEAKRAARDSYDNLNPRPYKPE